MAPVYPPSYSWDRSIIGGATQYGGAGSDVASAGDFDGDGCDDIIIAAPGAHASFVVFGKPKGLGDGVNLASVAAGHGGFALVGGGPPMAVASAGDVNGDGFDDLVIGAPLAGAGAVYLVLGHAGGFQPTVDLTALADGGGAIFVGEASGDGVGGAVASAGDVNGDGLDDVVIGTLQGGAGAAYVVFGRADGYGDAPVALADVAAGIGGFVILGEDGDDHAGVSVAAAGDLNGDGLGDIIIGATGGDGAGNTRPNAGDSYVVFGRDAGFGSGIDLGRVAEGEGGFVVRGASAGDATGWSVGSAGDVNGDGLDDIAISSPYASSGSDPYEGPTLDGATYVVFGKAGGMPASLDLAEIADGTQGFVVRGFPRSFSGFAMAGAGDINGDGFDDLLIGMPFWDTRSPMRPGGAFVVFGQDGGFGATIDLQDIAAGHGGFALQPFDRNGQFGFAVAAAGDVDGDGFDDVIIGAPTTGDLSLVPRYYFAGQAELLRGGAFQPGPTGTDGRDTLLGAAPSEGLTGLGGADRLVGKAGRDTLAGGGARDRLLGGQDADVLSGGHGGDRFILTRADLGSVDRILDFSAADGDRVILRRIDAVSSTLEDDAFIFIGRAAFSNHAGELRWEERGHDTRRIEGDVDGDGHADLIIDIANETGPVLEAWFVL